MSRINGSVALALAVGLVVAGYFSRISSAQVHQVLPATWPPQPELMVNLAGEVTVQPKQPAVIYTVPSGHWLVITHWSHSEDTRNEPALKLAQLSESVVAVKAERLYGDGSLVPSWSYGRPAFCSQSGVGFAFKPDSQVAVMLDATASSNQTTRYALLGYLVPR